jgi:hypothetical protein
MINGNVLLLVIAGALTIAALIVGYFAVLEVVRVMRDFFTKMRAGNEVSPKSGRVHERSHELRSRAAVERLITHFEEPEANHSTKSSSE